MPAETALEPLLVELLTEELPPHSLQRLMQSFAEGLRKGLAARDLLGADAHVRPLATPRRLAAIISQVRREAPRRQVRDKVLPVSIAFAADGTPSATLTKKLAAMGHPDLDPALLTRSGEGKAEALYHVYEAPGARLEAVLSTILAETLAQLPIAKPMRYQLRPGTRDERTVSFVRPAHGLIALWGDEIVPAEVLGMTAGRTTAGHRFLCDAPLVIPGAADYERVLHEPGRVVASYEERRDLIREQLTRSAAGASLLAPAALVEEVTALVEWPVVYAGHFEAEFLAVPQECLVLTMQQHQRYFALTDASGRMQNRFLVVSNLATDEPAAIIAGNERVLRARLADAKFFYESDLKRSLESRLPLLDAMVYHRVLGSLGQRVARLGQIALSIGALLDLPEAAVERAARLAKADLVTDMVGDFPELQGIMGRYYATADGEDPRVAEAIEEHYRPRFSQDAIAASALGRTIALADKLEILVGMFAVGNQPTGESDPFQLRRHALGILRTLIEARLPLSLSALLQTAASAFVGVAGLSVATAPVHEFLIERLRGLLRERGYTSAEVESVLALAPDRIDRVTEELAAVRAFAEMPEAASLAAANKRIGNILKKSGALHAARPDQALFCETAEQALADALAELAPGLEEKYASGDYTGMLKALAALREPVDRFFDDVMVMTDDARVRANRLALLAELHGRMNRIADLSKLAA